MSPHPKPPTIKPAPITPLHAEPRAPCDRAPVEVSLATLNDSLSQLADRLDSLEVALRPVLTPSDVEVRATGWPGSEDLVPGQAPLVTQLNAVCSRVSELVRQADSLKLHLAV